MAKSFLVTGGGGFLGGAICRALKEAGHNVYALGRGAYPELEALGVGIIRHNLETPIPLSLTPVKFDGVFHVAAKVEMWGKYSSFYRTNVIGTENIIKYCKEANISNLVYTSSPSVIADDSDASGINESHGYPERHLAPYPATKSIAERRVLEANSETLRTLALRPHLIWGPGDRHFVPTILKRSAAGRLVRVGSGKNLVDVSYIEDCVKAHLLGMDALSNNPASRGRAYFISQGEPVNLWSWIDKVLELNQLAPIKRGIPAALAKIVGRLCELAVSILPGHREPFLTKFLACQMSRDHYFDISAAKKELGYEPQFSVSDALNKTFKTCASQDNRK
jgi:nucleoside-diphosphate-sugar epimerase